MNKRNIILLTLIMLCCLPMAAQLQGSGYYRFRNAGITDDYISIANDKFSYQFLFGQSNNDSHFKNSAQIGGGLGNLKDHTSVVKAAVFNGAEIFLKNAIHLVKDPNCTDPSTIIYLEKGSGNNYNIIGQGTSLKTLTAGIYEASVRMLFYGIYASISSTSPATASIAIQADDVENISYNSFLFSLGKNTFLNYAKLGNYYFTDNSSSFSIISSSNVTNNEKWYVEKVTQLNVNPTLEYKGKYYTTMYVPFEYKLGGGVLNAYAISAINDDGTLEKDVVATNGGTVPAGTPVVLECSSDVSNCYLELTTKKPLFSDPHDVTGLTGDSNLVPRYAPEANTETKYGGINLLKGVYFKNEDAPYSYQYNRSGTNNDATLDLSNKTTYVESKMYVLGVGSNSGRLGFFRNANTVMKANKAWLEIPSGNANEVYTLDFDNETKEGGNDE